MKIFILTFFFSMGIVFSSEKSLVQWKDYSNALQASAQDQKLVFVFATAKWCLNCRAMEKTLFQDPFITNTLNTRFHPTQIDIDSEEEIQCDGHLMSTKKCFSGIWKLNSIPSFLVIAPKGLSILSISQSLQLAQMRLLLN